jgi:hypothetical protein
MSPFAHVLVAGLMLIGIWIGIGWLLWLAFDALP